MMELSTVDRQMRESTPDIDSLIPEKLNGAIFSAWYTDRIWIDDLKAYRDQIKVDEDEFQIVKVLKTVNRKVKKQKSGFTGIERELVILNQAFLNEF